MNDEHEICQQQHPIKDIQLLGLNHYAYVKLVLCISYKMKYLQNEARKIKYT
jgi:hypothetical protein